MDDNFKPGSFGCHEAMHMASFFADAVDTQLVEHPAVMQKQEWAQLAIKARQALSDLYNRIAASHCVE